MKTRFTLALLALPLAVHAQQEFPATLRGHAWLPAQSFVAMPADAPASFAISGKFVGPEWRRSESVGSIPGNSYISAPGAPRATGGATPIKGQPVQGFSSIKAMKDGTFWVLTDNGFGAKRDSADAMLVFHQVKVDWKGGKVAVERSVFLRDPDRKVPFLIVTEATQERYLTVPTSIPSRCRSSATQSGWATSSVPT